MVDNSQHRDNLVKIGFHGLAARTKLITHEDVAAFKKLDEAYLMSFEQELDEFWAYRRERRAEVQQVGDLNTNIASSEWNIAGFRKKISPPSLGRYGFFTAGKVKHHSQRSQDKSSRRNRGLCQKPLVFPSQRLWSKYIRLLPLLSDQKHVLTSVQYFQHETTVQSSLKEIL
jgi:hypothetical protein